jgi:hypothetical protein
MSVPRSSLLSTRAWNIAIRTAHIATMGILLGGHAFDVPKADLESSHWWCIGTGLVLVALEAGPRLLWFHQGRGLMVLAKMSLIGMVPFFWDYRLPILLVVVVLASVGSHMPARFRYYSVLRREVIRGGCGPGESQLDENGL